MVQHIEDLLQDDESTLEDVEETLTEGYARALELEAERLRIERRIGEVARGDGGDQAAEIRQLGSRLTHADGELQRLRAVLASLADRARALRGRR
ncbi:MAG TPA: hypothetical protein VIK66_15980 [Gaiellaceae bacterium]